MSKDITPTTSFPDNAVKEYFHTLPHDVFKVIKSFISSQESYSGYRNLLNTSKSVFSELKQATVSYNITCKEENLNRMSFLTNNVRNSSKQVRLSLRRSSSMYKADVLLSHVIRLFPQGLLLFSIIGFPFRDISCSTFGNIVEIELIDLPEFTNLSDELHGVKILHFRNLPKLIDVSGISKSTALNSVQIWSCSNLSDSALAPLYGIKNVSVRFCDSISGITHLGNHEEFDFCESRGRSLVTCLNNFQQCQSFTMFSSFCDRCDYSSLETISRSLALYTQVSRKSLLPLNRFIGDSLELSGFELIHSRFLRSCPNLTELKLSQCTGIDFADFQTNVLPTLPLKTLHLSDFNDIINTKGMEKIEMLRLSNLASLVSLNDLGVANKNVCLENLPQIRDFSPLQDVYEVCINSCPKLVDVSMLKKVKKLVLFGCTGIINVSALDSCRSLLLHRCNNLLSLKGVNHIKKITISHCVNLEDIDDVKGNHNFKISDCPKILL
jgi:hypothetical protein